MARESKTTRQAEQPQVSEEQIRTLAYEMWEKAGRPPGDGSQFWAEAQQQAQNGR